MRWNIINNVIPPDDGKIYIIGDLSYNNDLIDLLNDYNKITFLESVKE